MIKSKYVLALAAVCLLVVSCKSSPKKNKGGNAEAEQTEVVQEEAGTENTEDSKKSKKEKKSKKSKKSDAVAAAEKAAAETTGSNFTGWIQTKQKDFAEVFGIVQIKMKAKFGTYSLSLVNEREKKVPVISAANEFTTNSFYLKNSQKIYRLTTDTSVKSAIRKNEDGASVMYSIPNVADVVVDFKFMATDKKAAENMVKVTATVTNRGKRNDDFQLKTILDTVLGESDAYHFYTWEGVSVKNEVVYRTLQNQKWFVSKNTSAAMQMFFSGADCTTPSLVALANYSTLEKNSWEPDMASFRAFDTVLSYNNSAVCAIWNPLKLAVGESGKVVFYLAFGVDGAKPEGEIIIYADSEAVPEELTTRPAVEVITDAKIENGYSLVKEEGDGAVVETGAAPVVPVVEPAPVVPAPAPKVSGDPTSVDYYLQNITPEHLTNEYIQALLDKIAALEEDSPSLNRQELLELNAELDAILTYLRQ